MSQQGKQKNRQAAKVNPKKKKRSGKLAKGIIFFLLIGMLLTGGVTLATAWVIYMDADVSALSELGGGSTTIYDRKGETYVELSNSRVDYVSLNQIPEKMRQAIVAIEDNRYYDHQGVDIIGISRAAVQNILQGGIAQGGSTITQQLAKNKFLTAERTFTRKFKEAVVAFKIEQNYSKDQILEQYLNTIYYGEGAWGIQNASEVYFGKGVEELTLAQSALLAGLPKAPSNYSPAKNPDLAKSRRDLVLTVMADQGWITAEERDQAIAEDIHIVGNTVANTSDSSETSSYVDYVIEQAIEKTGLTEQEVLTGGLHIYTALDRHMQDAAESVYLNREHFPEDVGGLQSGIALVDSRDGGLRALVGQLGEKNHYRGFNFATQTRRQPGSAMKPIVSFAPALMQGFKPIDQINDVKTDFGQYTPMNYGGRYHGWVTLEKALVESYNIPAVALLREIGIDTGLDLARQAGLPISEEDRTLGIALGGMTHGASPLQMAQAYTMFANQGVWSEAYAIEEIYDRHQKLLYQAPKNQKQLLSPSVAYEMTLMMQKVVTSGTGTRAQMNRPVAGKTGTTQLPRTESFRDANGNYINGTRDAWFVGYTPQIVGAVWLGYPDTDRDHYLTSTGGRYPAEIFKKVVEQALADTPVESFVAPDGYSPRGGAITYINGDPPIREPEVDDVEEQEEELDESEQLDESDETNESDETGEREEDSEEEQDIQGEGGLGNQRDEEDQDQEEFPDGNQGGGQNGGGQNQGGEGQDGQEGQDDQNGQNGQNGGNNHGGENEQPEPGGAGNRPDPSNGSQDGSHSGNEEEPAPDPEQPDETESTDDAVTNDIPTIQGNVVTP